MRKITLDEIGRLAGVSRATVSRVINDYPYISDEVRERVQRVIHDTGYQPNLAARSLASNHSNILGLVIPSVVQSVFTDPYFPRLIQGISQACNANDYTLSLFLFHSEEEEQKTLRRIIGSSLIDGLIITETANRDDESVAIRMRAAELPFVLVGRPHQAEQFHFVDCDNLGGADTATRHLIQLGYQRIAHLAADVNTAGLDRLEGYKDTLRNHNCPVDPTLIAYGNYSEESGYRAMQQVLPAKPDAVFAASDAMALGALRALREANLTVPEDVALIGFDDLPPATIAKPTLSTIRQPIKETGQAAVETLLRVLEDETLPPQHIYLPTSFIVRESCGALLKNN